MQKGLAKNHESSSPTSSYAAQFGGSVRKRLCATSGAESWLASFARIIGVRPIPLAQGPAITFVEASRRERFTTIFSRGRSEGLLEGLPSDGWRGKRLDFIRYWYHPSCADLICEVRLCDNPAANFAAMANAACVLYHSLVGSGALPMHAALLQYQGRGVLLIGEGGVGKTTCCRRVPAPWIAMSDDEVLIAAGANGEIVAHAFPTWSDFVRDAETQCRAVELAVPLSAIFFLFQASEDKAVALGQAAAAAWMTSKALRYFARTGWKSYHSEDDVSLRARVFHNACLVVSRLTSFELRVSLNGRFWDELERVTPI